MPSANRRSAIDLAVDADYAHVKTAVETFFRIPATADSWRYCFGIVTKHGYSVNVDLFARLDIFCRSMMVSSVIALIAVAAAQAFVRGGTGFETSLAEAGVATGSFLVFLHSSRTYSRAFVGAIYEGFYSWYAERTSASA